MNRRWLWIIGSGVIVGLILVVVIVVFGTLLMVGLRGHPVNFFPGPYEYESNGERIYFTATSNSDRPMMSQMSGMHRMQGMMACVTCHGPDGRGGTVTMMMETFEAPDIRYHTLTEDEHEDSDKGHTEHPPYTDATIKRAITQGLNPAGDPLDWPMPRWQMSDSDLEDLLAYLKTL